MIIEALEKEGIMLEVGGMRINSLWFADDSTLLAGTVEAAERNLEIIKRVGEYFGLEINRDKSMVIVCKGGKEIREIGGIKVVNSMKYLGVDIGNKGDIFGEYKEKMIKKSEEKAGGLRRVVERSYCKLDVGKM